MHSTKFTGIGKYTQQLIKHLAKIDKQNTYLLYFNNPEFESFQPKSDNFHKILVDAPHYSLKEQTKFPLVIHKTNPDLVHFTHFNSPLLSIKPQVTTIHDLTLNFYPGKKYNKTYQRLAYKGILHKSLKASKRIIAVSKNTEQDLHKLYSFTRKKTTTIYEGVDEIFQQDIQKPDLEFELPKKYLLYTGNWRSHKNLPNLIKAFHILKEEYNYKGKLILTGKPNPLYPQTKSTITRYKLNDDVIMPGLIPEGHLPYLYQQAQCYVFPSFYEGFGLPILEAFATKTPVCTSNTSCLPEIGGNATLTFNPNDPTEIALRINQILTTKDLREKLIQNGTERLQEFSFQKMAQQTLEVYNSLLN